ncbi:metallophosphoesterase family protein [Desertibacillus haloalkaliphilus]|uniref:metallophosphoesterase family protein n=1 Tax=Desertibacillus haloalkaliphilus TaxID=1328930 RepID=UPI001C25D21F|nr:DNA repair exonuclease [Desertibacillus haloalkaliphilus]MBU8905442.1 DNA repair exonuclease [Desertibacillus haloalkaliphilus]
MNVIIQRERKVQMADLQFIHAADLHLDSPFQGLSHLPERIFRRVQDSTFTSFTRIVDEAIRREVDFVLLAGDLYDGEDRSLKAQSRLKVEMKRLEQANIAVYVIHGNHDHLSGRWARLDWPSNVYFFRDEVEVFEYGRGGDVLAHIYGYSYPRREVIENISKKYTKKTGARYHIGLLHGQAQGSKGHDPYAPFSVQELLDKEFDYWALGHIHQYQQLDPTILYPGNIQGRNRKEIGEKGCVVVHLSESKMATEFVATADIIWKNTKVSITGVDSVQEIIDRCEEAVESNRERGHGVMLTFTFVGHGPLHSVLADEEQVHEWLNELNDREERHHSFVWIVSYQRQTTIAWDRDRFRQEDHIISDFIGVVDQRKQDQDFFTKATAQLYKHRRAKRYLEALSSEEQERLIEEAEALIISELLKEDEQ